MTAATVSDAVFSPVVVPSPAVDLTAPVSTGVCFELGNQYSCAIFVRRDGIADVIKVDDGRAVC